MKNPMFKPCDAWAEKLAATHPDDISPSERAALEAHIAECPACAIVRSEYRLMDARILDFPDSESLLNFSQPLLGTWKTRDDEVSLASPALDRIYRDIASRSSLSGNIPTPVTIRRMRRATIVVTIVAVLLLLLSLLLNVYFLSSADHPERKATPHLGSVALLMQTTIPASHNSAYACTSTGKCTSFALSSHKRS